MAQDNTRDVTPDDFAYDNVPDYKPTEEFAAPAGDTVTTETVSTTVTPAASPAETVALEREPVYIPPADPVYEEVSVASEPVVEEIAPVGRGTIDFGLLLLRLCFGAYLIISSLRTFFRLGGSEGIAGLESAYANYPFGNGMAIMVPTLELAAGVFIVLGLITPVAAAVAVAVTAFAALHAVVDSANGWNVLAWDASVWLPWILVGIALTLQFTGPGLYGVDNGRSWARRPLASSWIWLIVGLAAAGLIWWFATDVNPFVV
ncbi:DoxX family protein [Corynebacterium sp. Q4381]|uniref:DoxX family protein n=1 Tax=Corynebacterium sp. Marseille-Q4381 TaxID=3121597 RepID=UPI002FE58F17